MSDFKNAPFEYSSIGGWLLVLCLILIIGNPLMSFYGLVTAYNDLLQYFELYPGLKRIMYIDFILNVFLVVLSIRAGIALWTIKQHAVKIAKTYFLFYACYAILTTFLPFIVFLPSEVRQAIMPEVIKGTIRSLIYVSIWYFYLHRSKRVKATYSFETQEDMPNEVAGGVNRDK
jgi:hypothetical protein